MKLSNKNRSRAASPAKKFFREYTDRELDALLRVRPAPEERAIVLIDSLFLVGIFCLMFILL